MTAGKAAVQRFAGEDEELKRAAIAAYATMGASSLAGAVGLADLFMGSANGVNSGEIPLNAMLTMLPALGAISGGAIAGRQDPLTGFLAGSAWDAAKAHAKSGGQLSQVNPEELQAILGRMAARANMANMDLKEYRADLIRQYPDATDEQIQGAAMARSGKRLARGAAIGAALGAVPAIGWMMDPAQRQVAQPPAQPM